MSVSKKSDPNVFMMLGVPGAGKSFFARQFAEKKDFVHVSFDFIRYTIFDDAELTDEQEQRILQLMDVMAAEHLRHGQSIVYDGPLLRRGQRKQLRESLKGNSFLIIWVQTDLDSAHYRSTNRDRRTTDDRFNPTISDAYFDHKISSFQKPLYEDYVVVSGKHVFTNQYRAVMQRLVLSDQQPTKPIKNPAKSNTTTTQISKPVQLGGRVNQQRRVPSRRIR